MQIPAALKTRVSQEGKSRSIWFCDIGWLFWEHETMSHLGLENALWICAVGAEPEGLRTGWQGGRKPGWPRTTAVRKARKATTLI